jgi:acyl-coenzyme A thioesterase PaaI-like protein
VTLWQTRRPVEPHLHPTVRGRERELAALTTAVRRLIALTVTTQAPPADTARVAAELDELADQLDAYVPAEPPYAYVTEASPDAGPDDIGPFDVVHGEYNPLALPVVMSLDPPRAIGRARFTKPYEGPPGCVHGAVLCAVFDMVLTAANRLADAAGPTVELSVRYRRPTRLDTETVFTGWVSGREGRITNAAGTAQQGDTVTVEATGTFVRLPRARVMRLGDP